MLTVACPYRIYRILRQGNCLADMADCRYPVFVCMRSVSFQARHIVVDGRGWRAG
ncbi:hypothetical protein PADK2_13145 [Pseudomonas aeruginosa DK2]|nr:hypothetical protein PADK2_13145 [Pseudomonas aeruginosa DK2]